MEYSITIGTIIGLMGAAFAVVQFLKGRDKEQKEFQLENQKRDTERAELKIRIEIYKNELDALRARVDTLDIKLMEKIESLSNKIDKLMLNIMDKKN